jgi:hypothetical protein
MDGTIIDQEVNREAAGEVRDLLMVAARVRPP